MGKKHVGIIITWETWKGFDKLASKRKIDTEDLINRALLHFLSENEVEIETKALKRKIELDLENLCQTMNIAHKNGSLRENS